MDDLTKQNHFISRNGKFSNIYSLVLANKNILFRILLFYLIKLFCLLNRTKSRPVMSKMNDRFEIRNVYESKY